MFKLNEDTPTQHLALIAVAGVLVFLSMVDAVKSPATDKKELKLSSLGPRFQNPTLTWYERVFCRGYQRSFKSCGFRFIHPMRDELEEDGKRIKEGAAPDGVIVYEGHLRGTRDIASGKFVFDPMKKN